MGSAKLKVANKKSFLVFILIPMLPQSKVEIDPAMQRDAGYYECQVDLTTINTACHIITIK